MAGKFASAIDEFVWAMSLDGCEDEAGSVEFGAGWFGMLHFCNDEAAAFRDDGWFATSPFGAIVHEDGFGFVGVEFFGGHDEIVRAWAEVEANA